MEDYLDLYSVCEITVENVRLSMITYKGPEQNSGVNILHTHSFYEIFLCKKGELQLEAEGKVLSVREDGILIVPPGIRHRCLSLPDALRWDCLGYTLEKVHQASPNDAFDKLYAVTNQQITAVENVPEICRNLFHILCNASDLSFNGALRLCAVLDDLSRQKNRQDKKPQPGLAAKTPLPEITSRIDNLIDFYYAENITLSDVSDCLFLSKRQLTRIIKEHYGKTFLELLNDKRIEAAKYRLETTGFALEKIAVLSGFSSQNGFYREFKKRCDITPAAYREQAKKSRSNR